MYPSKHKELLVEGPEAHIPSGLDVAINLDLGPGERVEALGVQLMEVVEIAATSITTEDIQVLFNGNRPMERSWRWLLSLEAMPLFESHRGRIEGLEVVVKAIKIPSPEQKDIVSYQGG